MKFARGDCVNPKITSRSPHGERGLKCKMFQPLHAPLEMSLPPRGAWIEILYALQALRAGNRRSPHGERGLKYHHVIINREARGRSPHGERGLKYFLTSCVYYTH